MAGPCRFFKPKGGMKLCAPKEMAAEQWAREAALGVRESKMRGDRCSEGAARLFVGKTVAHADFGNDETGVGGIFFNFAADISHKNP